MNIATDIFSTVLVTTVAFAACNIGEVFILMSFYLDRRYKTAEIVVGQYVSAVALLLIALLVGLTASAVSPTWLHALGILPIFIGIRNLFQEEAIIEGEEIEEKKISARMGFNMFTVAAITFADASDNLGVFAPLFADSKSFQISIAIIVFLLMVGVLCWTAHYLLHHEKLGKIIRRYGTRVAPIALIIIGFLIVFGIRVHL